MSNFYEKYFKKKITFTASVETIFTFAALFFVLSYWGLSIYWYTHVGLNFVSWHTHLILLFTLWLLGYLMLRKFKFVRYFTSFFIFMFFVELFFVIDGRWKTYYEKLYGSYVSLYIPAVHTHHHIWNIYQSSHQLTTDEFSFWRPTNPEGFSDIDWNLNKRFQSSKKILALGDSFTEGDGAAFDSSYVAQLDAYLEPDSVYMMMNGGVCGSDPFENYMNLKNRLLYYKPEIIIQTISSHDVYNDIAIRGGLNRFLANDSLMYRKPPVWEPIYAMSYTSRIIFSKLGYNELLINPEDVKLETEMNVALAELFDKYSALCDSNGVKLFLVFLPGKNEIEANAYDFNFSPLINHIKNKNITVCNLLPSYRQKMSDKNGRVDYSPYYWKVDGHHNARGYGLMAECIYSCINSSLEEKMP